MTKKTCPDCNDYLYQDQMSSDLICYECETYFEKDFDECHADFLDCSTSSQCDDLLKEVK